MAINPEEQTSLNTGFMDIDVQSDFGLGDQSQLITPDDVGPSQPYKFTRVQETIPAAPPIGVGGKFDPYSANELNSIITPFTDPDAIKERRKKERNLRGQIRSYGDVAPLFSEEPTLDISTPEPMVIKPIETPDPNVTMPSLGVKPELVRQKETYDVSSVFNESVFAPKDKSVLADVEKFYDQAGSTYQAVDAIKDIGEGAYEYGMDAYDYLFGSSGMPSMGTATPAMYNPTGLGTTSQIASRELSQQAASSAGYQNLGRGTGQGLPGGRPGGGAQMGKYLGYAGTAMSAYGAYDAFKSGDTLGGVSNTANTLVGLQAIGVLGSIPGLQTVAIALTALNFISSITGWGRGKPKPGFGGSEISLREDGTFQHDQAYSYNGFDPSGAKKHTDMAMKYLTEYQKELGLKINYGRAQEAIAGAEVRGGNYLRRVDVSPWKDGSGSASEMIERWLSAGVFDGTPTYYDAYTGQREGFQSQEQYETYMQNFSNRVFT
tara:strand:+ start:88 stop:1560 length:1473 start_codon:yes stop_codon:yes gene_type:complete